MARFRKAIVRAGVYDIPREDGSVQSELITPERLEHWAQTGNSMQASGLRIPGPWAHDAAALPIRVGSDGTLTTSFHNAGFWERFQVSLDEEGVPTLYGEIDVPGDENDPNTPAGKVGKTVKETSIYVRPKFRDGSGQEWEDALMHVALVTHPIEKGQKNFEGIALSMSHCTHPIKMAMSGDITELIKNLREVAKVSVPEDTSPENLIERLNAALLQKRLSEGENKTGNTRTPPSGARETTSPVITMSFSQKQAEALLQAGTINPDTGKPFTKEDFEAAGVKFTPSAPSTPQDPPLDSALQSQLTAQQQVNTLLMSHLRNAEVEKRETRMNALIRSGRISQEYADQRIKPLLEGFQMSFDDQGNIKPSSVDVVLDALEQLPSSTPQAGLNLGADRSLIPGSVDQLLNSLSMSASGVRVHEPNWGTGNQLKPDEAQKLAEEFLKNTGNHG